MQYNLVTNGNFETGTFEYWTVHNFDTPAQIVQHNGSYQARMNPGEDTGQQLLTLFKAGPGAFTLNFHGSAPKARDHEDPPELDTHPFVLFTVSGFKHVEDRYIPIQIDFSFSWLKHEPKIIQYSGTMHSDVTHVEVGISCPSDPNRTKGPLYFDNVKYIMNAKAANHLQGKHTRL